MAYTVEYECEQILYDSVFIQQHRSRYLVRGLIRRPRNKEVAHDAAVESEMILRRRPFCDILSNLFTRMYVLYDMMLQGINDTILVYTYSSNAIGDRRGWLVVDIDMPFVQYAHLDKKHFEKVLRFTVAFVGALLFHQCCAQTHVLWRSPAVRTCIKNSSISCSERHLVEIAGGGRQHQPCGRIAKIPPVT